MSEPTYLPQEKSVLVMPGANVTICLSASVPCVYRIICDDLSKYKHLFVSDSQISLSNENFK